MYPVTKGKQKAARTQTVQQVFVESKMELEEHLADSTVWKVQLWTGYYVKSTTGTSILDEGTALTAILSPSTPVHPMLSWAKVGSTQNDRARDLVESC